MTHLFSSRTMREARRRAAAGAQLLDDNYPAWRKETFNDLALSSQAQCILGQTFGTYLRGKQRLCLDHDLEIRYGFYAGGSPYVKYRHLQTAWEEIVYAKGFHVVEATEEELATAGD